MAGSLASIETEVKNQREDIKVVPEIQKKQHEMDGALGVMRWLIGIGIAVMGVIIAAASAGAAYAQLAGG